jgi:hypothetical protein
MAGVRPLSRRVNGLESLELRWNRGDRCEGEESTLSLLPNRVELQPR